MTREGFLRAAFGRVHSGAARWARRQRRRGPPLGLQHLERRLPFAADLTRLGPAEAGSIYPGSDSVTVNSTTYFAADDGVSGTELWRTNGTAAGTWLVRDIKPGGGSSYPEQFTSMGPSVFTSMSSSVFFTTVDVAGSPEVWRTDGTSVGTKLVAVFPDPSNLVSAKDLTGKRIELKVADSSLFLRCVADGGVDVLLRYGVPLGVKVGLNTPPSLVRLRDFQGSDAIWTNMASRGSTVFFAASGGAAGAELWKSDGTVQGTVRVRDIRPVGGSDPQWVTAFGSNVYFTADDGVHGRELWMTNGDEKGTVLVSDIRPGAASSSPASLVASGLRLIFTADDGTTGRELWTKDVNKPGVVLVKDMAPGGSSSDPSFATLAGSTLYFTANDGVTGRGLWKSDGTALGTALVKDVGSQPQGGADSGADLLTALGATLYFTNASHTALWRSDGKPGGTTLVRQFSSGIVTPLGVNGNTLLLAASDGDGGVELWKSTGTAAGTAPVMNINPNPLFTDPSRLTAVDAAVYFAANRLGVGSTPFVTDGTPAGTDAVVNIELVTAGSSSGGLTAAGSSVFIVGKETATLAKSSHYTVSVRAGNGPVETLATFPIIKYIGGGPPNELLKPTAVGSTIFFAANDGTRGTELWTSNGTLSGTGLVKDIVAGAGGSHPEQLTAVGSELYFVVNDGVFAHALWKSNGKAAGTMRVKALPAAPTSLTAVDKTLFFTVDDGGSGPELWKSDGSDAGTVRVKDIRPGQIGSSPHDLVAVGSTLYFVANDGVSGEELWKSDGSAIGTVRVKDILPGAKGSAPTALTAVGSLLYFSADNGTTGQEPWVSDGAAAGTRLVKDVFPGVSGSAPTSFTAVNSTVFFAATHGVVGRELWQTDGTAAGTSLVKDVRKGVASSSPAGLLAVGSSLFFTANDGALGSPSIWRLKVPPAPPALAFAPGVDSLVSQPEATQAAGLVTVAGAAGNTIAVSFMGTTNGQPDAKKIVNKFVTGQGLGVGIPVKLDPADLPAIGDGLVYVIATQYDAGGKASDPAVLTCTLDTSPPFPPLLAMGPGLGFTVPAAKAVQPGGIVTSQGVSGLTTTVLFYGTTNGQIDQKKLVIKYVTGKGAGGPNAVTLTAADLATIGTGPVLCQGLQYDAAGNFSAPAQMWLTIV